jgi:hypothetical protein
MDRELESYEVDVTFPPAEASPGTVLILEELRPTGYHDSAPIDYGTGASGVAAADRGGFLVETAGNGEGSCGAKPTPAPIDDNNGKGGSGYTDNGTGTSG